MSSHLHRSVVAVALLSSLATVGCSSGGNDTASGGAAGAAAGSGGSGAAPDDGGSGTGGAAGAGGGLDGGGGSDDGGVGPDGGDAGTLPIDIVVATDGTDTPTCGAESSPCRTLKYAAEERAHAGQNIGIQPGTYDEIGSIALPKKVSVAGLGGASDVVLRPGFSMGASQYLLNLTDPDLDQDGSQSLSNLTFEGHSAAEVGWRAVHVQNRSNVHIHHCRFTNWDRTDSSHGSRAVQVDTTYAFPYPRSHWWSYLPNDLGAPNDYSTWTEWPKSPVVNFEFDHNFVYRSGANQAYSTTTPVPAGTRPGQALELVNLKDSKIHHNEFDLRGVYADAIRGISAFWDHVDTYNNVLRSTNAYDEGWMGPSPTWKANFVIETWLHNGCEFRDNISNDGFSITFHKDGAIHHNILLRATSRSMGIETGYLHDSQVHHNYIVGGKATGISVHTDKQRPFHAAQVFENIISHVDNWGMQVSMSDAYCDDPATKETMVYQNVFDTTLWGGLRIYYDCQGTVLPGAHVFARNNVFANAQGNWKGLAFEIGPSAAPFSTTVENNLFHGNGGGQGNGTSTSCRCVDTSNKTVTCVNGCTGRSDIASVTGDPELDGSDIVVVNDGDSVGTNSKGNWVAASAKDIHRYGDDARVSAGVAGDYFEFSAQSLPTSTATLVAIWWPRNPGEKRAAQVPVKVFDGQSSTPIATYFIDEASWDSSDWYYLGLHVFTSGTSRVRVESVPGAQVVADAVLWSKLGRGYQIASGSPAVNAGTPAVTKVVTTDFFGNPVPNAGPPDIGIHER